MTNASRDNGVLEKRYYKTKALLAHYLNVNFPCGDCRGSRDQLHLSVITSLPSTTAMQQSSSASKDRGLGLSFSPGSCIATADLRGCCESSYEHTTPD